jgi:Holliday junction resolvase RusA-like endonuclease
MTLTPAEKALIYVSIPGRPVPCPRPRVGVKGTYYPEGYTVWRDAAQRLLRDACVRQNGGRLLTGPLSLEVTFQGAHGSADLDNLVKSVLDAAQGMIFDNDRQVVQIQALKLRGGTVGTVVNIVSVDPDELEGDEW